MFRENLKIFLEKSFTVPGKEMKKVAGKFLAGAPDARGKTAAPLPNYLTITVKKGS